MSLNIFETASMVSFQFCEKGQATWVREILPGNHLHVHKDLERVLLVGLDPADRHVRWVRALRGEAKKEGLEGIDVHITETDHQNDPRLEQDLLWKELQQRIYEDTLPSQIIRKCCCMA